MRKLVIDPPKPEPLSISDFLGIHDCGKSVAAFYYTRPGGSPRILTRLPDGSYGFVDPFLRCGPAYTSEVLRDSLMKASAQRDVYVATWDEVIPLSTEGLK